MSENIRNELFSLCVSSLKHCSELINTYAAQPEKEQTFSRLKDCAQSYCNINNDYVRSEQALKELEETVVDEQLQTKDLSELYQELLSNVQAAEAEANQQIFQTLPILYGNSNQEASNRPSTSKRKSLVKNRNSHLDDEDDECERSLTCSQAFDVPKDPLTKKPIVEPCRNGKCGHVYEHKIIINYLTVRKKNVRCPYIGCANTSFVEKDLILDDVLKQKIKDHMTQESQSERTQEMSFVDLM